VTVGALLLAAGAGRRAAPRDKLTTRDPAGRSLFSHALGILLASRVDRILVLLGERPERLVAELPEDRRLSAAVVPDHAEGVAASLRAGIGIAGAEGWQAAFVCLADMPWIRAETLDRMTVQAQEQHADAVVPVCQGRRGNPVLWQARMFPRLRDLKGDTGGRHLLSAEDVAVEPVDTDDPGILCDYDTPERLDRFAAGERAAGDAPCLPQRPDGR